MTDEQIIKALENSLTIEHIKLYLCDRDSNTSVVKATDILDLIKRQQAEIDRLNKANKSIYEGFELASKFEQDVRAEAIKEFAEMLKAEYSKSDLLLEHNIIVIEEYALNEIVKNWSDK